jgi:hypothetical protein
VPDQDERLAHLLVLAHVEDREFTRRGGGDPKIRDVERRAHGQRMQAEASTALAEQDQNREQTSLEELEALGVVVTIEGSGGTDYPLRLDSLEQLSTHRADPLPKWLLLSVAPATDSEPERALVWVSDQYRAAFLKLFEDYLTKLSRGGRPLNRELVANMARIRATVLRDLWQSGGEPDETGLRWWELWLLPTSDAVDLVERFAQATHLTFIDRHLYFDTRTVVWIRAQWSDLLPLPFTAVPIAEIRRPQFVDTIEDLPADEQEELVTDLVERIDAAGADAPAVCLIDSGIRRTHVLLAGSVSETDMHSIVGPPVGDIHGHGTRMAGLALYGPLDTALLASTRVTLQHRLESVKLLPDSDQPPHDPDFYGLVTAEAVAAPEAVSSRRRAYCMPITTVADRPGEPSLWSVTVDALAAGTDVGRAEDGIELLGPPSPEAARLVIISAGNVDHPYEQDYRQKCDLSPIEDPAQAWNALAVGCYTALTDTPNDPSFAGWTTVAPGGDISPHSRTGVIAGGKPWPIKPDICMEGGNVLTNGATDFHHDHPLLSLLTTDLRSDAALGSANATSAAAAQASRLAALAMARYPSYWPEAIRALLVHSAEWTPVMRGEILAETGKEKRALLLKRYGWGVPDEVSVLSSGRNAVTMVVQDEFVPFTDEDYRMRNFRLHELPWPREVLADLGPEDVDLRVTLSYFIEPTAARRGWRRRYAYASHGLRFELRGPNEDTPTFVRRVNREAAREEEGDTSASSSTDHWMVGPNQRNKGSLHQDIWEGHGAELAATGGVLAVHAVGGWWKNNKRKDRRDRPVRYALVVSLRTRIADVDLYTPIATQLEVPVTAVAIEV